MKSISSSQRVPTLSATDRQRYSWERSFVVGILKHLQHGQVTLKEGREESSFGVESELRATLRVHDPLFFRKILFGGSIGAGESYIDGLWDCDNLTALIRIMVLNGEVLERLEKKMAWLTVPLQRIRHFFRSNNRKGSRKNILAHYDLGNEMYRAFLDPTMMYSAAIYPTRDSSLEEAAVYKLDHICRSLDLKPGDRVLEIGSGWGGFALHAAAHYGCHVTTTTISEAQFAEAGERIRKAGLDRNVTLLRQDYRDLKGEYDKLVSIEMIEAVGDRYLPGFFRKCASLLKPDGMMLLQGITIRDQLYKSYLRNVDFIQRHIFPGGCLVSNQRLMHLFSEETDMVVRTIEDFGFDYARTLRDWRQRFLSAAVHLEKLGYDERFRRLWEFYFCYCEGGFLERSISVVQVLATRPQNRFEPRQR